MGFWKLNYHGNAKAHVPVEMQMYQCVVSKTRTVVFSLFFLLDKLHLEFCVKYWV